MTKMEMELLNLRRRVFAQREEIKRLQVREEGEWIWIPPYTLCSRCGRHSINRYRSPYCQHCGRKMKNAKKRKKAKKC